MKYMHIGLAALLLTSMLFSPVCLLAADAKAAPKPAPHTHTILIKGLQFIPAELRVNAGDTVIWSNADIVPHTINATRAFDSRNLGAGQSWRLVTQNKGRFNYACAYHPTMLGVLIVQ